LAIVLRRLGGVIFGAWTLGGWLSNYPLKFGSISSDILIKDCNTHGCANKFTLAWFPLGNLTSPSIFGLWSLFIRRIITINPKGAWNL